MRILFIDDDPEHVAFVSRLVRDVLGAEVEVVSSVEDAVAALQRAPCDLVVTDIFIPLGRDARYTLGPRSRSYAENLQHLGGLLLIDELERLPYRPKVLTHTACTDFALIEVLGDAVTSRVPKPAPPEVLLRAVLDALELPSPG